MNIEDLDQEDDLTGVVGETARRAVRRFIDANPLVLACPHTGGPRYTALAESRTWCESCAMKLGLPDVWRDWPTCMACGRVIDSSTKDLGWFEALGSILFITTCHECAGQFVAIRAERS